MANVRNKIYDLEERTAKFGENIIEFAKKIPKTPVNIPLISQLVGSGTSVGSNYCEADCAESKKILSTNWEFVKKNLKNRNIGLEWSLKLFRN